MKKVFILLIAALFFSPVLFAQAKAGRTDTTQHPAFYTCSMHPEVGGNAPGKCPKCGMDLNLSTKEQIKAGMVNDACRIQIKANVAKHDPRMCPQCGRKSTLSPKEQMKVEVVKLYTCPMHPDVALNKEGVCPKCALEIAEKKVQW